MITYLFSLNYKIRSLELQIQRIQHPNIPREEYNLPHVMPHINLQALFDLEEDSDDDDDDFVARILTSMTPLPIEKFPIQNYYEEIENSNLTIECPICYEETKINNIITLQCNNSHSFCDNCILKQLNTSSQTPHCALCRELMTTFCIRSEQVREKISAKIF